jgi:hypothetical protein
MLTVTRAVVQVDPKFHPEGSRFLVKPYPKDKEYRRFKLSTQITAKLRAHVIERDLGRDDLLFEMPVEERPRVRVPRLDADIDALGRTEPNAAGRRYRHGTLTGCSLGRCRCDYCRDTYCRYRAARRANGKDDPRGLRACDTDGHIPANWFRESIWKPAVQKADLVMRVRIHDLRHAHASWLQMGSVALTASFGGFGERPLAAVQRAALGQARRHNSPCTMRDLGCHHPLASGRTMMQPVRLQQIPA